MITLDKKAVYLILGSLFILYITTTGTLPGNVISVALGIIWGLVIINALWNKATS